MIEFDSYIKMPDDLNRQIQELFIPTGVTTETKSLKVLSKRTAKAKRIFAGKVLSIEDNIFSAEIKGADGVYQMRVLKKILSSAQLRELAVGAKFEWIVRHDYSKDRNGTKVEIVFKRNYEVSDETLQRLMDESTARYGDMFRDED